MSEPSESELIRRAEEDVLAERGKSIVREMLDAGDAGDGDGDDSHENGVGEGEGEGEGGDNRNLDIRQVLFLLRKKVSLGPGLPPALEGPPWRLPSSAHPGAQLLNLVLEMSIEAQEGRIKDSGDFEEFIVSNSSLAIAGLVRTYLKATMKEDLSVSVALGVLLWDPSSRQSEFDFEGAPHVWLTVAGRPIDNAHVEIPDRSFVELAYRAKREELYLAKENPFKSERRLYLGQEDSLVDETVKHNLRIFREYGNDANVEKYVVFALHSAELNPSVMMYHILMRHLLRERLGVEAEDLESKWAARCWKCGKGQEDSARLKTCTACTRAKYCDKVCQEEDWKAHKLLHKEKKLAEQILQHPR